MAVVWGFRIAIKLAPYVYRVVASGGVTTATQYRQVLSWYWDQLHDPTVDPATLSAEMSAALEGIPINVTDYSGTFECRKLQVRFQRTPPGGVIEDVDVCTMHFLKLTGVTPDAAWVDADYTALEGYLDTWWGALKNLYISTTQLGQYRWYKSGPAWDITPAPYNPAVRVTEKSVVGTATGTAALPPQCAISVTEKTATRPTWGRFYLPAPSSAILAAEGLVPTSGVDQIANATVALFNSCRAASKFPVVFTRARGEYERRDGTILAAKESSAHTVDAIQVDNLYDVIRSRRWETTTYRKITTLT